ncbi:MAG: FtsW/RodA/SpoVE family cell cycle protein, partial [Mariprofundales bacterium]
LFVLLKSNNKKSLWLWPFLVGIPPLLLLIVFYGLWHMQTGDTLHVYDAPEGRQVNSLYVSNQAISQRLFNINDGDHLLMGRTSYAFHMEMGTDSYAQEVRVLFEPLNRIPNKPAAWDQVTHQSTMLETVPARQSWWLNADGSIHHYALLIALIIVLMLVIAAFMLCRKGFGVTAASCYAILMLLAGLGLHLQLSLSAKHVRYGDLAAGHAERLILGLLLFVICVFPWQWLINKARKFCLEKDPFAGISRYSTSNKQYQPPSIYEFMKKTLWDKMLLWNIELCFFIALGMLILQNLAGGELGVGGVQPLEIGKILLLLYLAWWMCEQSHYVWLVLIVLFLLVFALIFTLHDMSPLLMLGSVLWFAFWVHNYSVKNNKTQHTWLYYAIALLTTIPMIYLVLYLGTWLDIDVVRERTNAWLSTWQHTSNISQFLANLWIINAGGWWGAGLGNFAMPTLLPRVDDDAISALLVAELGAAGFALYIVTILSFAYGLLANIMRFKQTGLREVQYWQYFTLLFTLLLLVQALLVLACATGLLPFMGQPLPLISRAGSNIVGFVLAGSALAIYGLSRCRILAENHNIGGRHA